MTAAKRFRVEAVIVDRKPAETARRIDRIAAEGWRVRGVVSTFRNHETFARYAEMTEIRVLFEADPDGGARTHRIVPAAHVCLEDVPQGRGRSLLDRNDARVRTKNDLNFAARPLARLIARHESRGESFVALFSGIMVGYHDLRGSAKPLRRNGEPTTDYFEIDEWPFLLFERLPRRRAKPCESEGPRLK